MIVRLQDLMMSDDWLREALRRSMLDRVDRANCEWLDAINRSYNMHSATAVMGHRNIGARIDEDAMGRWTFTDAILFGSPITVHTVGDLREWMTMGTIERANAIGRLWQDRLRFRREMSAERPQRSPRTALGFGLLGPVAPPAFRVSVTIDGHGSRTYDPRSLRITMTDGAVLTCGQICWELGKRRE